MTFRCVPCECGGTCDKCQDGTLRELLERATPGPWKFHDSSDRRGHKGEFRSPPPHFGFMLIGPWINDADPELMALAPDLASLVLDMADALRTVREDWAIHDDDCHWCRWCGITNGHETDCEPTCYSRRLDALLARVERLGSTDEENGQ